MEADVVRWLQCLRHTVADEELEPWNLFTVYRDSVLDSTIDHLFDFDSTTSVSDFEYYNMDRPNERFSVAVGDDDKNNSVLTACSQNDISVSFKPKWFDVMAWKNELKDHALDGTLSEDEQVFARYLKMIKN